MSNKETSERIVKLRSLSASFRKSRDIVGRIENHCAIEAARGQWSAKLLSKSFPHTSDLAAQLEKKGYVVFGPDGNFNWVVSWDDQ